MRRDIYLVRLSCIALALLTGYAFLAKHLFNLQISRHDELLAKARQKYTARRKERGKRGFIYDTHGNLLVGNLACRDVMAEPRRFKKDLNNVLDILASELNLEKGVLKARFEQALKPGSRVVEMVVKRQVDIETSERLKNYHIRGLRFVESSRRYYPKDSLMANLLGFTNTKGEGVVGVEKLLNTNLQPHEGEEQFERDRRGRTLREVQDKAARDGDNVYLTLSEPIQQIMEDELKAMVDKHAPSAAYAVMANPKTGAVMGMAQYPNFDPNNRQGITPEQWQNRILLHGFEPGSTMKCVAIAGALDYGVVTLDTVFDCEGGYWFFCGKGLRDSGHNYEDLAVWEIIQKSSNIGTAKIALAMGKGRLYQTLYRFGFGQKTGMDCVVVGDQVLKPPMEASGIFRSLPKWDGLSISRFPIGQGILVTPLQMVQAYCALANDGVMMQLHTIDRIENSLTGEVQRVVPAIKERVLRPGTAAKIIKAMKLVTRKGGTATKAAVDGYEVAGKTGTAQKVINGQYSNSKYVASFIGFVPADDPSFVLIVVADEPTQNGYYGGTVAAPAFSRMAEKTLQYLQIAPAPVVSEPSITETVADVNSQPNL